MLKTNITLNTVLESEPKGVHEATQRHHRDQKRKNAEKIPFIHTSTLIHSKTHFFQVMYVKTMENSNFM